MRSRNWKSAQPHSLRQALEWSLEFVRVKRNLSPEQVANRMGMENHWTLYKWMQTGRIPMVLVPTFELVCGINLVSRWLAATGGKLLIDIPTGRNCTSKDTQQLQGVLHECTGALLAFYDGATTDIDKTISAIHAGLEALAWHRGNVQQHTTPQLELGGSNDE